MGPPLQHHNPTYTQAAKDICRAAWNISEVTATLLDHANAATTPEIKSALSAALNGCKTELYTTHLDVERVSVVVRYAAGVLRSTDFGYGMGINDGIDYDTRHNRHPFVFLPPHEVPPFSPTWPVPNGRLPGE